MHDDAADADRIRRVGNAQSAVAEEHTAEPPALLRAIDGETAEHGDRDRIGHVAAMRAMPRRSWSRSWTAPSCLPTLASRDDHPLYIATWLEMLMRDRRAGLQRTAEVS